MRQKLLELKDQALAQLVAAGSEAELGELRTQYLGRKGLLTGLLRKTGTLPAEERPAFGQLANQVKQELEAALDEASAELG
ncbi:MAG: phenylalanine--tRNA ligase subunit alpha, partial [Proteobacteria bacterium]|nr:phenylalanine--tRNA ligase subunit alpha [Pseudomonadota bacterium]MBU1451288.1 phenylalanine--tRNA ligase subunit alpha [Pseudomonadota bacterium]MBU2469661.1 phenylalanine--tRNA ligase subunit alpha [Pseudomonadota bacterium]